MVTFFVNQNRSTFSCSHPKVVNGQLFSCGKCLSCKKKRIIEWSNRMMMENMTYNCRSIFVTLTYSPKFLPTDRALKKSDLQAFMKRLRSRLSYYNGYYGTFSKDNYLSCFYCGEYGSKRNRPHYHLILFGLKCNNEVLQLIRSCWNKGFVMLKPTLKKNFSYVAKYSIKEASTIVNGVSEFVGMSRKNAIGKRYLLQNQLSLLKNQGRLVVGKNIFYVPTQFIKRYCDKRLLDKRVCVYNVIAGDDYTDKDWVKFFNAMAANCKKLTKKDFDEFFFGDDKVKIHFIKPKDFLNFLDLREQKEKELCFKSKGKVRYFDYYNRIKKNYIARSLLKLKLAKYNRSIKKFGFFDATVKFLYSKRLKVLFYPTSSVSEDLNFRSFYQENKNVDLLNVNNFFYFKTYEWSI